jgi:hypothetical protein
VFSVPSSACFKCVIKRQSILHRTRSCSVVSNSPRVVFLSISCTKVIKCMWKIQMFKEKIFTSLSCQPLQKTISDTGEQNGCFNTLWFFVNFLLPLQVGKIIAKSRIELQKLVREALSLACLYKTYTHSRQPITTGHLCSIAMLIAFGQCKRTDSN